MQKVLCLFIFPIILFGACSDSQPDRLALQAFDVYCEMVANEAKPLALHYPMEKEEIDRHWNEFQQIAKKYKVKIYQENEFPATNLFPSNSTAGKSVILIYTGDRLIQYQQWRDDVNEAKIDDYVAQEGLARRLGRLLGYSPKGINVLLSKNSEYMNLSQSEVNKQITHLYYENLDSAYHFYHVVLGLKEVDTLEFQISAEATIQLHSVNEFHPVDQPKSTAIALLTDQLPLWYDHIQENKVPIKYTYKPKSGGPHDGFVAVDPGGYLLEFEQFKQHPENELFMAALHEVPKIKTSIDSLTFYGSITWTYHKDMLKMQSFYEEVLGFQMVADQGWTKIYQTSSSGFIGLVDERRGMEDYADAKSVEIEWEARNFSLLDKYAIDHWKNYAYSEGTFIGPEKYVYHIKPK